MGFFLRISASKWQREPVHLVKGVTRRTHCAVVVAVSPSTFKRKSAQHVDIPEPRLEVMDGPSKPPDVTPPEPVVWGILRLSEGGSVTDSVKALQPFHTRRTNK